MDKSKVAYFLWHTVYICHMAILINFIKVLLTCLSILLFVSCKQAPNWKTIKALKKENWCKCTPWQKYPNYQITAQKLKKSTLSDVKKLQTMKHVSRVCLLKRVAYKLAFLVSHTLRRKKQTPKFFSLFSQQPFEILI